MQSPMPADRTEPSMLPPLQGEGQVGGGVNTNGTPGALREFSKAFVRDRIALAGLATLAVILLAAIFAPVISPQNPYDLAQLDIMDAKLAPGGKSMAGMTFWLGTDDQ